MKRVINGLTYDTQTATEICELPCRYYGNDFKAHDTKLYRTAKGRYFLAGRGGPMSMWAQPEGDNGYGGGSGIRPLDVDEAREYAESADLSPEQMLAAGFKIEEA